MTTDTRADSYARIHERMTEAAALHAGEGMWVDRYIEDVPYVLARVKEATDALTELKVAAPSPLPFPGAFPGPVVDNAPTWGAYLRDVPDDGYDVVEGDPVTKLNEQVPWAWWKTPRQLLDQEGPDEWVLVRRTPQPATPVEVLVNVILSFPEIPSSPAETAQSILDALSDGGYRVVHAEDYEEITR